MSDHEEHEEAAPSSKPNLKVLFGGLGALAVVMGGMLYWRYTKQHKNEVGGSAEERQVAAKGADEALKARQAGEGVKQAPMGQDLKFDANGNLLGPAVSDQGLPVNRTPEAMKQDAKTPGLSTPQPPNDADAINQAAFGATVPQGGYSYGIPAGKMTDPSLIEATARASRDELSDMRRSALNYSTVANVPDSGSSGFSGAGVVKAVNTTPGTVPASSGGNQQYDSLTQLDEMAKTALRVQAQQGANMNPTGQIAPGEAVFHAVRSEPGAVCDMRFDRSGVFYRIPEGEYLDCTIVNRAIIDREDVPIKAIVRRDYISPDGRFVLIPGGSVVLLVGGKVQYQEQERIYIRSHRLFFPRGFSVYFPERNLPEGMDLMGGLGVPGKVNRHWMLQFLAAIGIGVVEGYAAFEAGPVSTSPLGGSILTPKQSAVQAASQNFNEVAKRIMDKYANIAPTITLPNGKPIKVYFSSDVLVSAYRPVQDTSWYNAQPKVR